MIPSALLFHIFSDSSPAHAVIAIRPICDAPVEGAGPSFQHRLYSQMQNDNDVPGACCNKKHAAVVRNCECKEMCENFKKSSSLHSSKQREFGMSKISTKHLPYKTNPKQL